MLDQVVCELFFFPNHRLYIEREREREISLLHSNLISAVSPKKKNNVVS